MLQEYLKLLNAIPFIICNILLNPSRIWEGAILEALSKTDKIQPVLDKKMSKYRLPSLLIQPFDP